MTHSKTEFPDMSMRERNRVAFEARKQAEREAREAAKPKRRSRRSDVASREEQHGRYIDCGPLAWDDK